MPLAEPEIRTPDTEVEACRSGDRAAQERVLREHAPMLGRLVNRLVRDRAEAEDVLQNTFAGALVGFARFRGEASFSTWLSQIAMRQVQEHWRRRGRAPIPTDAPPEVAESSRLDEQADAKRRLARLEYHLAALDPKKRLAFVLFVIEGRSVADVAALMGATQTGTRSRVMWARRALIARLRKDPLLADLAESL